MPTDQITIREATLSDADQLLEMRNHPTVRSVSFSDSKVSSAEHMRWLTKTLADHNTLLLVAEVTRSLVAQIRFTIVDSIALVSISVDPDNQQHGVGSLLLRTGLSSMRAKYPDVHQINAYIKPTNTVSQAFFRKNGFILDPMTSSFDGGPALLFVLDLESGVYEK